MGIFFFLFDCVLCICLLSLLVFYFHLNFLYCVFLSVLIIFYVFFLLGLERCIACRLCEFICPSVAIEVNSYICFNCLRFCFLFFISYRRCIYCGFCMHICPTDAICHSFLFCVCYY